MAEPAVAAAAAGPGFFAGLAPLRAASDTFDTARYAAAPDDWHLVVTDIVDSTLAVVDGRHKDVNFVAAMAIAALKNLCAPVLLPFLFGGDGSVVMVPPAAQDEARRVLARLRGLAGREFGLVLRVGMVAVDALRARGSEVRVGRFEPSQGNSFGVFAGGGVAALDAAMKGRGDAALAELAAIDPALDDAQPVELAGLSCRWNPLASQRGKMVALIIDGAARPREVHAAVMRLAGQAGDPRPVHADTLSLRWPPPAFLLEARALRRGGSLAASALRVLLRSLVARVLFAAGLRVGRFDPLRYRAEVATNTDFCRHDDTLSFVIDCPNDAIAPIRAHLDACAARGELRYGMRLSDTALMTCLVSSIGDSLHVHFVDGGDGGYTLAAQAMKSHDTQV